MIFNIITLKKSAFKNSNFFLILSNRNFFIRRFFFVGFKTLFLYYSVFISKVSIDLLFSINNPSRYIYIERMGMTSDF
ncbi:hypothetical protein BpHYR1_002708 [Brachionus plicatilis]|uniref:Uncharacterized protein n=1 Tax=Brachionus plicatilis TaxID=10195 RepID=A0A3M7QH24_BRAPC|nr:hypothetical protein BpHYR1_002708 [Brachionus plicatilis]